jgi:hypothetical protein
MIGARVIERGDQIAVQIAIGNGVSGVRRVSALSGICGQNCGLRDDYG